MPTSFHTVPVPLREWEGVRNKGRRERAGNRDRWARENHRETEGKGNRRGGVGNSLKINHQKCFLKSAVMQSIHSNKRSRSVTTAPLHMVKYLMLWFCCDTYTCNFPVNNILPAIFLLIHDVLCCAIKWVNEEKMSAAHGSVQRFGDSWDFILLLSSPSTFLLLQAQRAFWFV